MNQINYERKVIRDLAEEADELSKTIKTTSANLSGCKSLLNFSTSEALRQMRDQARKLEAIAATLAEHQYSAAEIDRVSLRGANNASRN